MNAQLCLTSPDHVWTQKEMGQILEHVRKLPVTCGLVVVLVTSYFLLASHELPGSLNIL